MESIWQDYKGRGLQVFTLDIYNGSAFLVQGFIDATGATHPVLRMGQATSISYKMGVDSYALVDANGVVGYLSTVEGWGGFNDARMRGLIDRWLTPTAVETTTWTAIKDLFRD